MKKTHSSDESHVSILVQAYINVPKEDEAARPTKGAADRAVLDRLAINISPKLFAYRIQLIKSWDQLKEVRRISFLVRIPSLVMLVAGRGLNSAS